ncbi:flagellar biosynthesis anti-sigma factor FlgM [Bacteriovorax sp. DB6_IX]|uniref:flagellar biosynthesis anti-sigma factor FlgM n=1 Tax=Bacteriovorax sp. DB6_IX TaxID=1353530 RepID=UPI0004012B42|nr:flagellar biosynthesis anti-sigma factor FlgM [Bacteriovorax sp. DB6_IX]
MNNIDSTRSNFFPNAKPSTKNTGRANQVNLKSNSYEKQKYIDSYTKRDAKVEIPEAVRDFSKIKKVADAAEVDNTQKIAALKKQIADGTYKVDYDALADKILGEEFSV